MFYRFMQRDAGMHAEARFLDTHVESYLVCVSVYIVLCSSEESESMQNYQGVECACTFWCACVSFWVLAVPLI